MDGRELRKRLHRRNAVPRIVHHMPPELSHVIGFVPWVGHGPGL